MVPLRYALLFSLFLTACKEKVKVLEPKTVLLTSADEIVPLEDSLVKPILYQNVPGFKRLTIKESKEKFIAVVLPAVLIAKYHLTSDREKVLRLKEKDRWSSEDSSFYDNQKQRFKANDVDDLLVRMYAHPNSIVLAQAAVESGWGSSRFFKEGNNLFGIWAYTADEPRIPANKANVYLRKYSDISKSIEDYFLTIGRARPYRSFRKARAQSSSVHELLPHLKNYSERGKAYTDQLKVIIRQNNLTKYDHHQIDPGYFVEH